MKKHRANFLPRNPCGQGREMLGEMLLLWRKSCRFPLIKEMQCLVADQMCKILPAAVKEWQSWRVASGQPCCEETAGWNSMASFDPV